MAVVVAVGWGGVVAVGWGWGWCRVAARVSEDEKGKVMEARVK